jgi:DNA modification methylase
MNDPSRPETKGTVQLYGERLLMLAPQELSPYPRNARTHSRKQIGQIAASIERFGFTNPVLIDEANMVLAGHGRVSAARQLGMSAVPCVRIASLTQAEKRAYILADNKLALNAGWDEDLLAGELSFLIEEVGEIDIELTGFTVAEIDTLLDGGATGTTPEDEEDDRLPTVTGAPVSRPGDVWCLGPHRLMCGDARDRAVYDALLRDEAGDVEQANMVFTDPPYNVPIRGHVTSAAGIRHREFVMASGEMESSVFKEFLEGAFRQIAEHSRDGSIHFICMDWRHIDEISAAGKTVYGPLKNLIVWVKDNGGMGSFYRSRHELIFVFKKGNGPHVNSFGLGEGGRYRTNVWNYRGVTSPTKEQREALALHPTVKPVAMVVDAIKDCSQRGDLILDPFCGSGTILIAAHRTGRRARAIELDPLYCDTAVLRWQAFAKDDATLEGTGQSYTEVMRHRRASARPEAGQNG